MASVRLTCRQCYQAVSVVILPHSCGGTYIAHVEGRCPVTGEYHEPRLECRHFVVVPVSVGRLTHFCCREEGHKGEHESCHYDDAGRPFRWSVGQTVGPELYQESFE